MNLAPPNTLCFDLPLHPPQADSTLPKEQRRNYKGVGDAMMRIVKEEGVGGLFRGGGPTVVRAMALNMGMLASNDQAKEMIEAAGFPKGGSVSVLGGASIAGEVLRCHAVVCGLEARERERGRDGWREGGGEREMQCAGGSSKGTGDSRRHLEPGLYASTYASPLSMLAPPWSLHCSFPMFQ